MTCAEAQEYITALIDQDLDRSNRSLIEAHLGECSGCRFVLEEERAVKQEIRAAASRLHTPRELRDRILSDPRIFSEKNRSAKRWQDYIWPMPYILRPALVVALLLAVALPTLFMFNQRSEPIAFAALETYNLFLAGKLPLIRAENPNEIKQQLIRAVDGQFEPMAYDLAVMNLLPVAGAVREMNSRKVLIAIYKGPGGSLLCYTFLGSEKDAPPKAGRFSDANKKINFYVFSHGRTNAVLHREGDVICILASEMPMQELLALAASKARPS